MQCVSLSLDQGRSDGGYRDISPQKIISPSKLLTSERLSNSFVPPPQKKKKKKQQQISGYAPALDKEKTLLLRLFIMPLYPAEWITVAVY